MIEVSVRDHGPGLSAEQIAKLFQPFVHIQTPDAPGSQGSGLGLAFCRQIIERHRGHIRAESSPASGTTVAFDLSRALPSVIFDHACQNARDKAQHEHGQFGLLLVTPAHSATRAPSELLHQAYTVLRRSTHRGDQFVWVDDRTFAIIAVTDQAGLSAMVNRLSDVLNQAQLEVTFGMALSPPDGTSPEQLLEVARSRPVRPEPSRGVHARAAPDNGSRSHR